MKRALDGRTTVPVAYDGASRFHTTAAANIAELCRVVLERRASGVFNIGDPQPPNVREIGEMIAGAMDHEWEVLGLPKSAGGRGRSDAVDRAAPAPDRHRQGRGARLPGGRDLSPEAIAGVCRDLVERTRARPWREAFPGLAAYQEPWFDYAAEDAFLDR